MRPHKMIKCLMRDGEEGKISARELMNNHELCAIDAPCFDFGHLPDISSKQMNDLYEYANDLIKNDMFVLPFEKISVSYCHDRYITDERLNVTVFMTQNVDLITICAVAILDDKLMGITSVAVDIEESKKSDDIYFKVKDPLISSRLRSDSMDDLKKLLKNGLPIWTLCIVTMLHAKGVEQRVTPAPVKLNKQRAAAGKPLIGEIREVLINVNGKRYMPSGEAEKGSHASPRLHWRRGHIRRLPSGEITHVRPCLAGSGVSAPTPTYRVKQSV